MAKQRPSGRPGSSAPPRPAAGATARRASRPAEAASRPTPLGALLGAELLGTFVLVGMGCGSALLAATSVSGTTQVGIGYLGVSLAFGAAVVVMAVAIGGISGGHFNPAVTVGLACAGRVPWRLVGPYVVAQIAGATAAGGFLFAVAAGNRGFDPVASGFTANGYGERSPAGFSLGSAVLVELVLTAVLVGVVLAVTDATGPKPLAPIAIGLTLTLANLVAIPVDNASINPARSLGVAWFAGAPALSQVWVFLLVPVVGGAVAGLLRRTLARSAPDAAPAR